MTRKSKLLRKFLRNPDSLKFREVETILVGFGYRLVRVKGSHYHYEHEVLKKIIFPIHANDCLKMYKHQLAKYIINNLI